MKGAAMHRAFLLKKTERRNRLSTACRKSLATPAFSSKDFRNVCAGGANSPPARQSRTIRFHFGGLWPSKPTQRGILTTYGAAMHRAFLLFKKSGEA